MLNSKMSGNLTTIKKLHFFRNGKLVQMQVNPEEEDYEINYKNDDIKKQSSQN